MGTKSCVPLLNLLDMEAQLDIFSNRISAGEIAASSRRTGLLPTITETAHLSQNEIDVIAVEWLAGCREIDDCRRTEARVEFSARGWPFAWLLASRLPVAEALEEAVDVVDRYYSAELRAAALCPESMGIAQAKGFGGCEGVQLKRAVYGTDWLVSVYAVTGPVNFSAGEGVEFEPGSRSHVFHLCYPDALPTADMLAGDVAAHPIITAVENRRHSPHGRGLWHGEGWTGTHARRPHQHVSWGEMKPEQREGIAGSGGKCEELRVT